MVSTLHGVEENFGGISCFIFAHSLHRRYRLLLYLYLSGRKHSAFHSFRSLFFWSFIPPHKIAIDASLPFLCLLNTPYRLHYILESERTRFTAKFPLSFDGCKAVKLAKNGKFFSTPFILGNPIICTMRGDMVDCCYGREDCFMFVGLILGFGRFRAMLPSLAGITATLVILGCI